jgi:Fuc2NAc and GlcNAc transferase
MHQLIFGVAIVLTVVISWLSTGWVRRHGLRNGLLDVPNTRSSHSVPTPRGGGIAAVVIFLFELLVLMFMGLLPLRTFLALECGGLMIAIMGLLDDRRPRPAALRFFVHVGAATLFVVLVGGVPGLSFSNFGIAGPAVAFFTAVMALTWSINLFNFMDGIDGIAASEAMFFTMAGAWLNWRFGGDLGLSAVMLFLGAAALGFLMWNWPPAKIFMGDAGSGFLGFALCSLAIAASRGGAVPIEAWIILGGVFFTDASITLLRRAAGGERWFEAHRSHAYQILARHWNSHRSVTVCVIMVNVLWLLPWALVSVRFRAHAPACLAAALLPLAIADWFIGAGRPEA